MADNDQQQTLLAGDANLIHTENVVSVPVDNVPNGEEVIQDILQQAFQEASGPYVQEPTAFTHGQVTLADGSSAMALSSDVKVEDGQVVYQLAGGDVAVSDLQNEVQEIHCMPSDEFNGNTGETTFLQQVVGDGLGRHVVHGDHQIVIQLDNEGTISKPFPAQVHEASNNEMAQQVALSQTVVVNTNGLNVTESQPTDTETRSPVPIAVITKTDAGIVLKASEPLGSSHNPIRIVQQGSQYTSLQQLSGEQLSQIMQVVQQQQLVKKTQAAENDSAVLYNPQTKTRIVYKVLYPSELHKRPSSTDSTPPNNAGESSSGHRRTICVPTDSVFVGLPKRTYRKRVKTEEDDKVEAPELSREEKDEKKKHRPRTRSGRVSRPPKHMVKDYKHIHPIDWDEDYDDSDGGYSDFQPSSGEGEEDGGGVVTKKRRDGSYMPYSLMGHGKSKPWKCKVCDKAYIGKAGLARHYRLLPEHGKDDENFKDTGFLLAADSGNSLDSIPGNLYEDEKPTIEATTGSMEVVGTTLGMTSNNEAAPTVAKTDVPMTKTTTVPESKPTTAANTAVTKETNGHPVNSPPKGMLKSKQSGPQESVPSKKKARLKEFIRDFSDEDLMETVLPRLSRAVSTWEFLLMKAERGRPARPQLVDLLQEYAQLYRSLHKMTEQQLKPVTPGQKVAPGTTQIQISDSMVATSLGLSTGMYTVQPPPRKEDSFRYKLLTTDADSIHVPSTKRTLETVNRCEMFLPSPKRPRTAVTPAYGETVVSKGQSLERVKPGQTVLKANFTTLLQSRKPQNLANIDHLSTANNERLHTNVQNTTASSETVDYASKTREMVQENGDIEKIHQPNESHPQSTGSSVAYRNTVLESVEFVEYDSGVSGSQVGEDINMVFQSQENHSDTTHVAFVPSTQQVLMDAPTQVPSESLADVLNSDFKPQLAVEDTSVAALDPGLSSVDESPHEVAELNNEEYQSGAVEVQLEHAQDGTQWEQFECSASSNQDPLDQGHIQHDMEGHVQQVLDVKLEEATSSVDPEQGGVPLSMEYDETIAGSHITQQYITENGIILDDSSSAQVLVQDEPFLVQNGFQETDDTQGEEQDPNEDNRLILIKNPDGTIQIHRQGNQPISLETLQTLLAMELNAPGTESSEAV